METCFCHGMKKQIIYNVAETRFHKTPVSDMWISLNIPLVHKQLAIL